VISPSDKVRLTSFLRAAQRLLVFTGAGISTGSGIPDFRGPSGVWRRRRPVDLPTFLASEEGRIEYWEYKLESWTSLRDARPTATHFAAVALERAGRIEAVVTQNIDGLHQLAGTTAAKLVEIHGTARRVDCLDCGWQTEPQPVFATFARTRRPPRCPECGGWLKPATISFGQNLNEEDMARAEAAAEACDAVIALGSTLSVYPAAGFPLAAAVRGVPYAIVNRGVTEHDAHPRVTLRLEGDVAEIFPAAVEAVVGFYRALPSEGTTPGTS